MYVPPVLTTYSTYSSLLVVCRDQVIYPKSNYKHDPTSFIVMILGNIRNLQNILSSLDDICFPC